MASNYVREELDCSICLEIYKDPVTLRCGHNFCRICIEDFLNTQQTRGVFSCPECREEFQDRSDMRKNKTLCNIAQHFVSTEVDRKTSIYCTYCDSPVHAVKSCLQCETSMCDDHLRKHKSAQHTLIPPTRSAKYSIHKKILEYYCTKDPACICVSCRRDGEHLVETLDEAVEKDQLQKVLKKLTTRKEETEEKVQKLKGRTREVKEKAAEVSKTITDHFIEIKRHLEDLEKKVLTMIAKKEEQISLSFSERIQKLETQNEELSKTMSLIDKLLNKTDLLTDLQNRKDIHSIGEDMEDGAKVEEHVHDGDLGESEIFKLLTTGLSDILSGVKLGTQATKDADIVLDINTAGNRVVISGDLKTVFWSEENQGRAETAERFEYYQVMSSRRFSSGVHSWEVETSDPGRWRIGLCYPSTTRKGGQSLFGNNKTSWCLRWCDNKLTAMYNGQVTNLPHRFSRRKMRIHMDYEAGRISFFELCDPIQHLYTFTSTFTEPLHVALCVWTGWVRILC